ncbi:hypothetical protein CK228_28795 [Mesorhizobium sp. WSM4312]|nr:hypothetical protein CK228_28795 [Mesorhizobium sp. WSM4312]
MSPRGSSTRAHYTRLFGGWIAGIRWTVLKQVGEIDSRDQIAGIIVDVDVRARVVGICWSAARRRSYQFQSFGTGQVDAREILHSNVGATCNNSFKTKIGHCSFS